MSVPVRIVFFSEINSKLGAPFLEPLTTSPESELVGLVTSPPGRLCSYFLGEPDPVDLADHARRLGVPVLRPEHVNAPAVLLALESLAADYFVVCNYQQIFKEELLAVPRVTCVNFHPSPLPRYAGLAPFYWMVRHGERDGAVSAIEMTTGIDSGPLLAQRAMALSGRETTSELRAAQEKANIEMLHTLLPQLAARSFTRTPQDETRRTYFGRPTDDDHRIDFAAGAESVSRTVRAAYRHPGAYTHTPDGERLTVLKVEPLHSSEPQPPLQPPGTIRRTTDKTLVATKDAWLHLLTVERTGEEVPADRLTGRLPQGALLAPRRS
ncbi:methionyl-tRNA formyltransferase [Streptomyces sp. NBC_00335]|uniref:methionyl-tRNA formyltransferase n=1 Tax=unclassified Streptomyces TaxID=2593676 RepID=UPI00225948DE|nr:MULTISPECIES: methionyl-tRNA formyltransferase [unclassified Streptomyces]MCX5409770.1 methionyl-tRNA formyltransferase [Streptomyces sp. NBC_00086]